ncbi:MAG TPA: hypothetical protein VGL48_10120 [Acidimicrobiales bacterium]|jgi:hypothetical protein
MSTGDFTPDAATDGEGRLQGGGEPTALSRRQALQRFGQGVAGGAVVGTAAWLTPELLIGRPTAAGASSAAPGGGGGSTGGPSGGTITGAAPGGSATTSTSSDGTGTTGQVGPSAGSDAPPVAAQPGGNGPQLAFTGLNVERAVEAATGLLVGGWILTRWSSDRASDAAEDESGRQGPPLP